MSSFASDSDFSSGGDAKLSTADAQELQQFLVTEQVKATHRAQVTELTGMCWEKCMEKPQSKLDSKTESCLSNCALRFVDVTQLIANRYIQSLQTSAR